MSQGSTASDHAAGHRATGNNARSLRQRRGPPREIEFTIVFDNEIEHFVLNDNARVEFLERMIEERLKIPVHKQFIYGWPPECAYDGSSDKSKTFKDLDLPSIVCLYVAVQGPLEPRVQLEVVDEPGTSTQNLASQSVPTRPNKDSQLNIRATYDFTVHDTKNHEVYPDIPFDANRTVKDVKKSFGDITCIPFEDQVWSGWPNAATDDSLLKEICLDTPVHSLFLSERKPNDAQLLTQAAGAPSSASSGETCESAVDKNAGHSSNQGEGSSSSLPNIKRENAATPLPDVTPPLPLSPNSNQNEFQNVPTSVKVETPKKRPTARKSTSKGALMELQQQRTQDCQNSPGTSRSTDGNQSAASHHQNKVFISSPPDLRKRCVSVDTDSDSTTVMPKKYKPDDKSPSSSQRSPRKSKECHLFKLPEKVVTKLLRYLDPVSELSLRRTCKTTKTWVVRDNLTPVDEEKWKDFFLTITEKDHKTFENAVNLSLPITRFIFDIRDETFYDTNGIDVFISTLSLFVKKLRLRKFYMFENRGELALLKSFHNLEELTLDDIVVNESSGAVPCPTSLRNLQILKLNYEIDVPKESTLTRPKPWNMTWGMLMDCQSLLYFRIPRFNENVDNPIQSGEGVFAPLLEYIQVKYRNSGMALEYLDFKHFNNVDSLYITRYMQLLLKCHAKDIKMKNVNALVVQQVLDEDYGFGDEKFKFCENVISLVNYSPFVENAPLRNIEKLKVDIVPSVRDYSTLGREYKDIFWEKLRIIKILDTYRAKKDSVLWANWQVVQEDLYGINGAGYTRTSVTCIKIDSPKLPYFLGEGRLAHRFVNLTKLEILSWCDQDTPDVLNKRLWPIWTRLKLNELKIENCRKLNDYSFMGGVVNSSNEGDEPDDVGDDDSNNSNEASRPIFLLLRKTLKKFTLGLDGVKNVTDRSFKLVFSQMKLRTFIIKSTRPTNISEGAILKMVNGPLNETIERFPFDTWSTTKVDRGRFERLGKRFRSRR